VRGRRPPRRHLAALADPTRRKILARLARRDAVLKSGMEAGVIASYDRLDAVLASATKR